MKVCFFDDSAEGIKTIRAYCDSHCRENISYSLNPDLTDFFRELGSCGISLIFLDTRVVRGSLGSFELAKKNTRSKLLRSYCVYVGILRRYAVLLSESYTPLGLSSEKFNRKRY